jgi:hypothetical protein
VAWVRRRFCSEDAGGFGSGNDDGLGPLEFCLEDAGDLAPALSQTTLLDLEVWVRWGISDSHFHYPLIHK